MPLSGLLTWQMKLIRFFLFSLVLLGYGPASAGESYRIGVLAFRGLEEATNRWQPTVTYLSNQFSDRSFQLIPLTLDKTGMSSDPSRR
jgi:hypothetical protein